MEGHMTRDELATALDMGVAGCRQIYEVMKQALRDRYAVAPSDGAA
jgi:ribonuclease PH